MTQWFYVRRPPRAPRREENQFSCGKLRFALNSLFVERAVATLLKKNCPEVRPNCFGQRRMWLVNASSDRLKRRRAHQHAEEADHDSEAAATRVAEGQWQDPEATSSELTMRDQQGGQTRIPTHEAAPEADSTSPHNSDAGRATSELDVAAHLTIPDEPQRWPHHRALTLRPQPLAALAPIMHSL